VIFINSKKVLAGIVSVLYCIICLVIFWFVNAKFEYAYTIHIAISSCVIGATIAEIANKIYKKSFRKNKQISRR